MAKNRPRRVIIFQLFKIVSFLIYLLPLKVALISGKAIGRLAFRVFKKERKAALANLDAALGAYMSIEEKRAIARQVFENLGMNFAELVSLRKFNQRNIDSYVTCRGIDIVKNFSGEGGVGAIALSAHLGNWELLAHYFAIKGFSVNVIARRVRMEGFEKFLASIRSRRNINIIYRDDPVKDVLKLLKKGQFVGVMPDQDMDSVSGVFVDFFGRPAYTPVGPAVINLLTKSPIIPCFIVRRKFGHEIFIEKPLELSHTGNKEKDIHENTRRYTKCIEGYIRKFPSQWVWFHERWKTRP